VIGGCIKNELLICLISQQNDSTNNTLKKHDYKSKFLDLPACLRYKNLKL